MMMEDVYAWRAAQPLYRISPETIEKAQLDILNPAKQDFLHKEPRWARFPASGAAGRHACPDFRGSSAGRGANG